MLGNSMEIHPFKVFNPPKAKYLLLGSFTAVKKNEDHTYDWYYGSKRNQFWSIIEEVYRTKLPDRKARQSLFAKLSITIADIILQCERKGGNSLDANLTKCVYNTAAIKKLLKVNPIKKVFFTSRFVESQYKKVFKDLVKKYPLIELITIPSPSPRYAAMKIKEKIKIYKKLLPQPGLIQRPLKFLSGSKIPQHSSTK